MRSYQKNWLEFVFFKAFAELKAESIKTYLSFLWWILDPLLTFLIFYTVFGIFLQHDSQNFIPFLLIGITIWNGFANTIYHGADSLIQNHAIMQYVYLPKWVFPTVIVLKNILKFFVTFILLIIIMIILGFEPQKSISTIFVLIFLYLFLIYSSTLFVSSIIPFFPDLKFLVNHFIHLLFFLSAVFYSPDMLSPIQQRILFLNPMAVLIDAFRDVIIYNRDPNWNWILLVFIESKAIFFLGVSILYRWDRIYPKIIIQ